MFDHVDRLSRGVRYSLLDPSAKYLYAVVLLSCGFHPLVPSSLSHSEPLDVPDHSVDPLDRSLVPGLPLSVGNESFVRALLLAASSKRRTTCTSNSPERERGVRVTAHIVLARADRNPKSPWLPILFTCLPRFINCPWTERSAELRLARLFQGRSFQTFAAHLMVLGSSWPARHPGRTVGSVGRFVAGLYTSDTTSLSDDSEFGCGVGLGSRLRTVKDPIEGSASNSIADGDKTVGTSP